MPAYEHIDRVQEHEPLQANYNTNMKVCTKAVEQYQVQNYFHPVKQCSDLV